MTAVPRPSPGHRFPRHCVVVHDLQLGPHTCAQSCYACPDLTAARCTRCHGATLRGEHAGGISRDAGSGPARRANEPSPHPPTTRSCWCQSTPARANTLRKCAAAAAAPTCMDQLPESRRRGRRRGRSPEFRDARGRAGERTQTAGWRSPCGVRRALWDEGFFTGLCRVFFRNIEDHHVLVQKGAENTSSLHGCA